MKSQREVVDVYCLITSVADVDAEERVDNSLVKILKRRFGGDFEPEFLSQY